LFRQRSNRNGRRGQRGQRGQLGQAVVELALILPLLMVILIFAVDVGRLFFAYTGMQNAAREAVIYAAASAACKTGGATCASTGVSNAASQEVGTDAAMTVQSVTCTPSCTLSSGTTEYRVTVTLSRPFPLMPAVRQVPGIDGAFFPVFTLRATATAVIQ
jgi:Flp pilus assembly protein TadG